MKKLFILIPIFLLISTINGNAQIFWTENFESGSTSGLEAGSYTGPNGTWTTTATGVNGADYNRWFVSCAENGHTNGVCGTGCAAVGPTATLATLHVGAKSMFVTTDAGASYDAGGLCPIFSCPQANQRAESPTINCTGKTGITVSFNYIENGDGTNDDATVWYYDGSTWALLVNTPKTPLCGAQGQWTYYSYPLPTSANGNPNVKIGFNWTNNDDGTGTDPSFAVDSLSLSTAVSAGPAPVASFTTSPTPATICVDSCITFTNTSTISSGSIDSIRWVGVYLGFPILLGNANTFTQCATSPYNVPGTYTFRLRVYGNGKADSATSTLTVNATPHPVITKSGHVLTVTGTYSSYQWSNGSGKITGATNSTYTYSGGGNSYTVTVDSGGCPGTSAAVSTVGVATVNALDNQYWVAQTGGSALVLLASDPLEEPLTVSIFDATGRQIVNDKWTKGNTAKQINGIAPSPGLYIIRLSNSNTSVVLKWMR